LALLFALFVGSQAEGADDAWLSPLQTKGLTKSGVNFILDAEKPAMEKLREVRTLLADYDKAVARKVEAEQTSRELAQLAEWKSQLQDTVSGLNQLINEQGYQRLAAASSRGNGPQFQGGGTAGQSGHLQQLIQQRNVAQFRLAEVGSAQNSVEAQPTTTDVTALDDRVKKRREDLEAAVAEVRPMVDDVLKRYSELGSDPEVKAAVNVGERATRADLKLGPSEGFRTAVKTLEQAERKLTGKTPPTSKKRRQSGRSRGGSGAS
jgi:hypothetical protein